VSSFPPFHWLILTYWASSVLIYQAPIARYPAQHPLRAQQHPRGGARTRTHDPEKEQLHESQAATRRLGPRHPPHVAAFHRRAAHTVVGL
ncbi:hypothetical protein B0H14DRAFT_2794112, partial [Mycena olivaceomarginata]